MQLEIAKYGLGADAILNVQAVGYTDEDSAGQSNIFAVEVCSRVRQIAHNRRRLSGY